MIEIMMWLVTAAALVGTVANIKQKRWCFAVWIATNGTWVWYDWRMGAYAQAALFLAYTGLSIWGWFAWKK